MNAKPQKPITKMFGIRLPLETKRRIELMGLAGPSLYLALRIAIVNIVDEHYLDLDPTASRIAPQVGLPVIDFGISRIE